MPSDKKRINLTVSDELYEQLQEYKAKKGIPTDASACLQLIIAHLQSEKNAEQMMKVVQSLTMEQLMQLSQEGLSTIREVKKND